MKLDRTRKSLVPVEQTLPVVRGLSFSGAESSPHTYLLGRMVLTSLGTIGFAHAATRTGGCPSFARLTAGG